MPLHLAYPEIQLFDEPAQFMPTLQNPYHVGLIRSIMPLQELYAAPGCKKKHPKHPGFGKATFVLEDVQTIARSLHMNAEGMLSAKLPSGHHLPKIR